jgi:hypothetical protein
MDYSYLPSNYFNVSIFRWSLCHFYEIIRLLLCFFSGLYFPPKHYGKNIRSASGFFIAGNPFVPWLGNSSVFHTFYLFYIWHCRIKLFLRHLPNCPCSNFSLYVDLFQEISPRIARQLRYGGFPTEVRDMARNMKMELFTFSLILYQSKNCGHRIHVLFMMYDVY